MVTQDVGSDGVALAKAGWGVVGKLQPATKGERVNVRLYRNGKRVKSRTVRSAADGRFKVRFRLARSGRYEIQATHRESPALTTATAKPLVVEVLPRRVSPGAKSEAIRALQRRLDALGYVVGEPGRFDDRTARAVLAFRKVSGIARTTSADRVVMRRLANGGGVFKVRFPKHGKHVEADLSRQVLALIGKNGVVKRIYHTSSGAPATPTVRGHYKFYLAQPGYNGNEMYYSKYFIGGYAIHGYKSVPVFNASHGCLRVPLADARTIYNWIDMGDRIDVYA
jgi:peptidoglycan hydrolase-like protein with peptidoglycan-binding domain